MQSNRWRNILFIALSNNSTSLLGSGRKWKVRVALTTSKKKEEKHSRALAIYLFDTIAADSSMGSRNHNSAFAYHSSRERCRATPRQAKGTRGKIPFFFFSKKTAYSSLHQHQHSHVKRGKMALLYIRHKIYNNVTSFLVIRLYCRWLSSPLLSIQYLNITYIQLDIPSQSIGVKWRIGSWLRILLRNLGHGDKCIMMKAIFLRRQKTTTIVRARWIIYLCQQLSCGLCVRPLLGVGSHKP